MPALRFLATFLFTFLAVGGFCLFAAVSLAIATTQKATSRLGRRPATA